ncbi:MULTISPECIES: hypothetical protein [unclassified Paenibacillus]|uniref:hypothetical protein n=1 Tax=unclassified Paenibacillus TaxID=185978 RepID=UPI00104C10B8|nr:MULTISPECIES: hypothetical protein [unclassified Paenibacillus]NIK70000.1 hypothetical protein [Paenibacillus sp. BK720]TCM97832.1 hypothetical protein EV294_103260 [Paenibacillus sp. BK033]
MEEPRNPSQPDPQTGSSANPEQPYDNPYASRPSTPFAPVRENGPAKQSGLGIASFILALVTLLLVVGCVISATVFVSNVTGDAQGFLNEVENMESEGTLPSDLVPIMIAGLCIIASIGVAIIGLILGIVGAVQKNRRKVFAIIGIVLNGLIVLGTAGLVIIGLVSAAAQSTI